LIRLSKEPTLHSFGQGKVQVNHRWVLTGQERDKDQSIGQLVAQQSEKEFVGAVSG